MRPRLPYVLPLLVLAAGCTTKLIVYVGPDGGGGDNNAPEAGAPDVRTDVEASSDAGPLRELAMSQLEPQGLALSPTTVYWTNAGKLNDAGVAILGTGSVASIPRGGGEPNTLESKLDEPLVIQFGLGPGDVPTLVWSAAGASIIEGTVNELVLPGGVLSVSAAGQQFPYGVAMDTTQLYWASSDTSGVTGVIIQSESLAGSTPQLLGSTGQNYSAGCLAIHGQSLFFTAHATGGGGALYELPITGGTPTARWTTTEGMPYGVAVDATNVYWAVEAPEGGAIYQLPRVWSDSGPPPSATPIAVALTSAYFVAVDSKNVYFATNTPAGSIYEVPIGGGKLLELASNLPYPGALAADDLDDFLYFTTLTSIDAVRKK